MTKRFGDEKAHRDDVVEPTQDYIDILRRTPSLLELQEFRDENFPTTPWIRQPPHPLNEIRVAGGFPWSQEQTSDTSAWAHRNVLGRGGASPGGWQHAGLLDTLRQAGTGPMSWKGLPVPPPSMMPPTLGVPMVAGGLVWDLAKEAFHAGERLLAGGYQPGGASDIERHDQSIKDALAIGGVALTGSLPMPRPTGSLGTFGGKVAADNLAKAGRPVAREALDMAAELETRGMTETQVQMHVNEYIGQRDPALGGVSKDATGQWRFEIDDSVARLTGKRGNTLGDALHHPDYFLAYPDARRIHYREVEGEGGMMMPGKKVLGIPLVQPDIAVGMATRNKLGTVLHEGQHLMQHVDNRQTGTNPGQMAQAIKRGEITVSAPGPLRPGEDAFIAYYNVAGEVEARAVTDRMSLTAAQRRQIDPRQSERGRNGEPLPREQQLLIDERHRVVDHGQASIEPPKPPPAAPKTITLQKKGKGLNLKDGNHKATFYIIEDGKQVGDVTLTYSPKTQQAYIWWIGRYGEGGPVTGTNLQGAIPNSIGTAGTRQILRELKKAFPDLKGIAGHRISGAHRAGTELVAQDLTKAKSLRSEAGAPFFIRSNETFEEPGEAMHLVPDIITGNTFDDPNDHAFAADAHIGRSASRRVEVLEVDDSGPVQMVTVMGLADEVYKLPLRGQGHGMTSVPPKGSLGLMHLGNGRPDEAFLYGLEHPDMRPKNRVEGEAIVYGKKGQKIELDDNGDIVFRTPNGNVYVNP